MNRLSYILVFALGILIMSCRINVTANSVSKVELKKNELGYYRLFVNGQEFFVKGAGIEFGNIEALAKYGGNSFRTWRTENGQLDAIEILDIAQQNGLMVLMGLEVARERHGFDYNDSIKVKEQFEYIKGEVERLKNHPALLGWAIGNELNLGAKNLKVYDAVNDISLMIHEIDPNHVTTTTTAGVPAKEIAYIKTNCTDIDFLSVQLYGNIVHLQKYLAEVNWEGPYMVTEWGATGHWEVDRTDWNVALEQTSTEKAKDFIERYNVAILSDPKYCLGSYVFLWGHKQERTSTWYGMFLENGSVTETVDAMQFLWKGEWPEDRCPTIESCRLNNKSGYDNIKLKAGELFKAKVLASEHENESLIYRWEVVPEGSDLGWGGDYESSPVTLLSILGGDALESKAPTISGAYRLFVYVNDGSRKAATANIPFLVEE